ELMSVAMLIYSLASLVLHSYIITYTKVQGIPGVEFTAVTEVDDQEVCYYDCNIQKLIPKQEWMKKTESEDFVKEVALRNNQTCTLFTKYTDYVKNLFSQTGGAYIYQRRYGCTWDSESKHSNKFDAFGYNGEDIITVEENKYILSKQARDKWKEDIAEGFLERDGKDCVSWLNDFLAFGKSHVERIVPPKVFLLRKDPSSPVVCQATGFYPANLTITWTRNGRAYNNTVDPGEFQLNEDGTFQMSSTLRVTPEEWKWYQMCTKLSKIKRKHFLLNCVLADSATLNWREWVPYGCGLLAVIVVLCALAYCCYGKCRKSSKGKFLSQCTVHSCGVCVFVFVS
uniref:Major histocompatibility complex class I-related gene protein-like n=1 Tax=Sinocyclocheilus anshuiensis TaxID=1608454 RepID=A0A671N4P4_9TELE